MKKYLLLISGLLFLFNLSAQDWVERTPLPSTDLGRNHPFTFSIDGYGYVSSGNGTNGAFDDLWRFDPVAELWEQKTSFPGGVRGYGYAVAYEGKGYAGFGLFNQAGQTTYFGDLWEYDPILDAWTELATCPCEARIHPAMVAVNGKIFVGLGGGGQSGDLDDWWEYDIATDSWAQKTSFPSTRRHHPYYFGIGDDVYVGMGHHSTQRFNDLYRYSVADEDWQEMATLPAQGRVAGTQFSHNGRGYLLSGHGQDHTNMDKGEFWEYDPIENSWLELEAHPGTGRWAPGSFVIGDEVFLVGGQSFLEESDMWGYVIPEPVNTKAIDATSQVVLSPNPAHSEVRVEAPEGMQSITIYGIQGLVILHQEIAKESNEFTLNIADLNPGIYMLEVKGEKAYDIQKLRVN